MRCKFSETQYSFGFTFEYVRRHRIRHAPVFPNLIHEGRFFGYDVRISHNTFFQFKIPEFFNKRNQGVKRHWEEFKDDYYKIKLNTNSKQFRLLKQLRSSKAHNKVYYATPEFYTQRNFSNHYVNLKIEENSAIFPVDNLPNHGSGHHVLIYHSDEDVGFCFSEPILIKKESLYESEKIYKGQYETTMFETAKDIRMLLKEGQFNLNGDFKFNEEYPRQFIREISAVLITNFNIHWLPHIYPPF